MMKRYRFPIEIQTLEEGGYLAICPILQGCHAEGNTIAEAIENLEDVAKILLELRREDGLPIPDGLIIERDFSGIVLEGQLVVSAP
jgi:predicted RNase H-like HicB family nuclease